ncbi:MAG: hypothetical protein H2057_07745 [Alphaproteobacteria bacterium]|nr:hypothetical protein [Alphaproteobacteria bacterium]
MRKGLLFFLAMFAGGAFALSVHAVTPCYKKPLSLSYEAPKETPQSPKIYTSPECGLKKADSYLNDHRGLPPERYGTNEERRLPTRGFGNSSYYSKAPADTMAGTAARSSGFGSTNRWVR